MCMGRITPPELPLDRLEAKLVNYPKPFDLAAFRKDLALYQQLLVERMGGRRAGSLSGLQPEPNEYGIIIIIPIR